MVESLLLRWVLTVLFTLTAVWCGFRAARPAGGWPDRLSSISHLAMSLLMIAMAWPLGMSVPAGPQIALFAVATGWFLVLTALRVPCGHARRARIAHTHHAVMSAAMVWMIATMPMLMMGGSDSGGGHHHHSMGAPSSGVLAAAATPGPPSGVVTISVLLAGFLVLSSVAWISTAVDTGRRALAESTATHPAWDSACHGAMSIGMGAMLLSMV